MKSIFALLLPVVVIAMSGCGRKIQPQDLAESLPNKMVPVEQTAEDAAKEQPSSKQTVVSTPITPDSKEFKLGEAALFLGALDSTAYGGYQKKWIGTDYPACNFFLITSLCEAKYCKKSKPMYKAGDFDIYLLSTGFAPVTLNEAKELFRTNQKFELVFQKQNPVAGRPGHVMVGVGLDDKNDKMIIAQGNLGEATNEIKTVEDSFLTRWQGGFTVFVRKQ